MTNYMTMWRNDKLLIQKKMEFIILQIKTKIDYVVINI